MSKAICIIRPKHRFSERARSLFLVPLGARGVLVVSRGFPVFPLFSSAASASSVVKRPYG